MYDFIFISVLENDFVWRANFEVSLGIRIPFSADICTCLLRKNLDLAQIHFHPTDKRASNKMRGSVFEPMSIQDLESWRPNVKQGGSEPSGIPNHADKGRSQAHFTVRKVTGT